MAGTTSVTIGPSHLPEAALARLEPDGRYVQWLTMFDLSRSEFDIIARTMLEVFPQVTLWRRGFSPKYPIFALIGRLEDRPLDLEVLQRNLDALARDNALPREIWIQNIPLASYAGNLSTMRRHFARSPINTDDLPLIE